MAENDDGSWGYSVHIYEEEESWYLTDNQLESTGEFTTRDEFYDGTSIHVKVDPETGEGDIIEN